MIRFLLVASTFLLTTTLFAQTEDAPPAASTARTNPPRPLTEIEKLLGRPASIDLLWQVIERDLAYGLVDEAAKHLKELMGRPDLSGEKLLDLREKFGPGLLIKLQRHESLAEQARPLVDMLQKASEARASDTRRISYFVSKLDDSASERAYAIEQINRSGPLALPSYLEAIRTESVERESLLKGLFSLPKSAWIPAAAVLEADDEGLLSLMLDLLVQLDVPRAAEAIHFIEGSSQYSEALQAKARAAIGRLTDQPADRLGSPVDRLVRTARSYDQHRSGLEDEGDSFLLWQWSNGELVGQSASLAEAEEFFGLRAARQALQLDPNNEPAKIVFLKLALETTTLRGGIDRSLASVANGALETSLASGPGLLLSALDEAIRERRPALALAAIRSLAETASPRVVSENQAKPSPLVEALNFPNSRVRFEAARAALELHPNESFAQIDRVVSSLAQALSPSQKPHVMVLDSDLTRGQKIASIFQSMGYEPSAATSGTEGYDKARRSRLVELFVIDSEIGEPSLLDTIDTFEKDPRLSGTPIAVIARQPLADTTLDQLKRYPHAAVVPFVDDPKKMAEVLAVEMTDRNLAPWTDEERNQRRGVALDWLVRLARGELANVSLEPAVAPLTKSLADESLASRAAEALSYITTAEVQGSLAAVALDDSLPSTSRLAAARALAKNIARAQAALPQQEVRRLLKASMTETDPALRQGLAAVVGTLDPSGKAAAERMKSYRRDELEPARSNAHSSKPQPTPTEPPEPNEPVNEPGPDSKESDTEEATEPTEP